MRFTQPLRQNRDFRRLYAKGRSAVTPVLAGYSRKNKSGQNRLGITVSPKVGNAVVRNRVRRRIREAYRTREEMFLSGYDIVIVARVRAASARYDEISDAICRLARELRLMKENEQK